MTSRRQPLFFPAEFCSTIYSLHSPALFFRVRAKKSGRQDLNLRPLDPQSSALGHKNPVKTHISEGLVPIVALRKSTNTSRSDPCLVELAKAWPTLPEPLRAGIMAMVQSAVK